MRYEKNVLLRDAQYARGSQTDVQHTVVFDDLFAEAVKGFFQEIRVLIFDDMGAVLHHKNRKDSRHDGIIPKTMKNSQLLSFVGLYSDPSPINTITVANTGNTDKTVLTFPRFVSSVTSVVQVLNAASYAVEPAKRHNAVEQDKQKA